jgi:hypothetical protein
MKRTVNSRLRRTEGMSWFWTAGSRIALLLTAAIVLVMPWTEYFWHFDKFLQGGQDFELGLLFMATSVCLVFFMLQHGKHTVRLLMSLRKWLSIILRNDRIMVPGSLSGLITASHVIAVPSPSLGLYTLPLQV